MSPSTARSTKSKLPAYFTWRDGRPRWQPGPALRKRGFAGRDLKGPDGKWLGYGAAIEAAIACNAATRNEAPGRLPPSARNMAMLFARYRASPLFASKRPKTRSEYLIHFRILEAWCGDIPCAALSRTAIREFHADAAAGRGQAMANALLRVLNIALNYAKDELEWLGVNRAARMKPEIPQGRLVVWSPQEIAAFVAAADALGLESQGDAVMLGALTGQRRADILTLERGELAGSHYVLRQRKRNARAFVPLTRALRTRLETMRERARRNWPQATHTRELIASRTGKPYAADGSEFHKEFRLVLAIAAGVPQALCANPPSNRFAPCASLVEGSGRRFSDLRDTAVTWLCAAGCTVPEIANITGHSLKTVQDILDRHYFVRNAELAASAGAKLDDYLQRIDFG